MEGSFFDAAERSLPVSPVYNTLNSQVAPVTGSRGNPAGAQLTVRAVPYEQDKKGKEEDTG